MVLRVLILSFFTINSALAYLSCSEGTTAKPPFYVSDKYKNGDKLFENLRNIEDEDKVDSIIPRGSIVHLPPELSEVSYRSDSRVPVRVLSIPDSRLKDELIEEGIKSSLKYFVGIPQHKKDLPDTEVGDEGFIHRKSLIPAGRFTFFVKKDSPFYKSPKGLDLTEFPLTLVKAGENFVGERCCKKFPENPYREDQCFFNYRFGVLDKSLEVVETFEMNPLMCSMTDGFVPVPNDDGFDMSVIKILERFREEYPGFGISMGSQEGGDNMNGLRLLPDLRGNKLGQLNTPYMIKIPMDLDTQKSAFNSYHYTPDTKNANDAFLRPKSLCAFTAVMEKFDQYCGGEPGCQLQFGNMFHDKSWDVHASHGDGTCVDIRPMRKSSDADVGGLTRNSRQYSKERTQKLVDILVEAGATPIIFNDESIKRTRWLEAHDDHLHVCFPANSKKVRGACLNGL